MGTKGPVIKSNLPAPQTEEWDWQLEGACRTNPAFKQYFEGKDGEKKGARYHREKFAKAVCGICPIMQACRAYALRTQEPYGVWGGLSEDDLKKLYR